MLDVGPRSVAAPASNREPPSPVEVRAIIATLLVEKHQLLKAKDAAAAEAIGLAIDYWHTVLARTREAGRRSAPPR
jgi:hypothetical protein